MCCLKGEASVCEANPPSMCCLKGERRACVKGARERVVGGAASVPHVLSRQNNGLPHLESPATLDHLALRARRHACMCVCACVRSGTTHCEFGCCVCMHVLACACVCVRKGQHSTAQLTARSIPGTMGYPLATPLTPSIAMPSWYRTCAWMQEGGQRAQRKGRSGQTRGGGGAKAKNKWHD